jgi:hypothetical protein
VKYIAWQTKAPMQDAFFALTSKGVEAAIGVVPDVTKMTRPIWPDYTKLIDTVGQRHQVESAKLEGFELLVYCLAVSQARSNNCDDVNKLYDAYFNMPFIEVLPAGFFFFKNFKHGKRSVVNYLKWLLVLKRIRNSRKQQELKG